MRFICGGVFAVLPTGFGRSLCYACLPDALHCSTGSLVVVISPLTAIVKDQVCIIRVLKHVYLGVGF